MKRSKTYVYATMIVLLLLLTGFIRDFTFKSINALLKARDNEIPYHLHASLSFMEKYEYATLVDIKWVLTLLFTGIYLLIALLAIKLFFQNRMYMWVLTVAYIGITLLSGILMAAGYFFGITGKMYEFARYLMGIAQSPVILMILIPLLKLREKEKTTAAS